MKMGKQQDGKLTGGNGGEHCQRMDIDLILADLDDNQYLHGLHRLQ